MQSSHSREASSRPLPSARTLGHLAPHRQSRRKQVSIERLRAGFLRLLAEENACEDYREGILFVLDRALQWVEVV